MRKELTVVGNEYDITLDTARTGIELLEMGGYDGKKEDIFKFSLKAIIIPPRTFKFKLINLGQEFTREDDAHTLLSIPGFRNAGIDELLLFGALVEPREKDIFVVAVNAYLDNSRRWCTWGIGYSEREKSIGSSPFSDGYGDHCRFLMVQN